MAQETLMTLADPKGLEPLIFCSVDRRLIQLGYGSIILLYRVFLKIKILKFIAESAFINAETRGLTQR